MRNPLLGLLKWLHRSVGGHGLGRLGALRAAYGFLFRLLRPRQVRVMGHRMFLDERDTLELATREVYEPLVTSLFERYVTPGTWVVDLGANIGYFTLLAAKLTGPGGRVLAFEPDPESFRLLKKNVGINGYQNVLLEPRAVSDTEGSALLFLNETNRGDHRLFDPGDGRKSVPVPTIPLDRALKGMQVGRALIKMDIQGSEGRALDGMRGFLASTPRLVLLSEYWPLGLKAAGSDPRRFLDGLVEAGFSLYEIDDPEGSIRRIRPEDLVRKIPSDLDVYTNVMGLKGEDPDPGWDR